MATKKPKKLTVINFKIGPETAVELNKIEKSLRAKQDPETLFSHNRSDVIRYAIRETAMRISK